MKTLIKLGYDRLLVCEHEAAASIIRAIADGSAMFVKQEGGYGNDPPVYMRTRQDVSIELIDDSQLLPEHSEESKTIRILREQLNSAQSKTWSLESEIKKLKTPPTTEAA